MRVMKRFRAILPLLALAVLFSAGCRVRDVRRATIVVPEIRNEACLTEAKTFLKMLPDSRFTNNRGDETMCLLVEQADFATGTLTIRYDAMKVGIRNLEDALSKAGFHTPTFPADAAARQKLQAKGLVD